MGTHQQSLNFLQMGGVSQMKSHMPLSILACLGQWFNDLMVVLDTVVLEKRMDSPEQQPRLKCWKRALQICCNLVSRHRKHVDK
jgi:hypothetical protein